MRATRQKDLQQNLGAGAPQRSSRLWTLIGKGRLRIEEWRGFFRKRKEAEAALQQAGLTQILLDSLPCIALLIRPHSREIVASNRAAVAVGAVPGTRCFATWGQRQDPCPWCLSPAVWATQEAQHEVFEKYGVIWEAHWIPVSEDLYMHYAFDVTERKRAEQALRESEQFSQEVISSATEGIIVYDRGFRYRVWNPFMERMTGMASSQVLGKEAFAVFPHLREHGIDRLLERALAGESVTSPETPFRVPESGRQGWVVGTYAPHRDADGEIVGVIATIHDITETKLAHEESESLADLLNLSTQPFAVGLPDGTLTRVNPAFCRLTGYSEEELLADVTWNVTLTPAEWRDLEAKHMQQLPDSGEAQRFEKEYLKKDGSRVAVEVLLNVKRDPQEKVVCTYAFVTDISERKRAEEALRDSEESLAVAQHVAKIGSWDWRIDEGTLTWSDETFRQFGLEPGQVTPSYERFERFVHPGVRNLVNRAVKEALDEDKPYSVDVRMVRTDGTEWVMHAQGTVYRNEAGSPIRFVGTSQDITERKHAEKALQDAHDKLEQRVSERTESLSRTNAKLRKEIVDRQRVEEALRQSEEQFRGAFETTALGMAIATPEGRFLKVNRAMCDIVGYPEEELLATDFQSITHPEDLANTLEHVRRLLAGEVACIQMEKRYIHRKGHVIWILLSVSLPRDPSGKPLHFVGQIQNITERKKAEEALRESEKRLLKAQYLAKTGFLECNLKTGEMYWSDEVYRIYGIDPGQQGVSLSQTMELVHPDDLEFVQKNIDMARRGVKEYDIDHRNVRPDGTVIWLHAQAEVTRDSEGNPETLLGTVIDITDRKRGEEALRESEMRFRTSVENLLDSFGIYSALRDESGHIVDFLVEYVNEAACRSNRMTKDDQIGKHLCDLLPGHRETELFAQYCQVVETGVPLETHNLTYEDTYDGQVLARVFDIRVTKLGDGIAAAWRDITDRIQAEEELHDSEQRFRQIVENIREVIWISNLERDEMYYVSPPFEEIWGRSWDSLTPNPQAFMEAVHPDDRERIQAALPRQASGDYDEEYRIVRPDGTIRWIHDRALPVRNRAGEVYRIAGVAEDITHRKEAEVEERLRQQHLVQMDKMATLGILTSGVAHEISNPNQFILTNAAFLSRAWEQARPVLDEYHKVHGEFVLGGIEYSRAREEIPVSLAEIMKGTERIKRIVEELGDFTREQPAEMTGFIALNSAVQSACSLLSRMVENATRHFSVHYGEELSLVRGNTHRFEQVVINLIQNSCQALRDPSEAIHVSTSYDAEARNVILLVEDEGLGIPAEAMDHITDPFFTTKRDSGGTGLGLTVAAKIVSEHGGDLTFSSVPGKGTVAKVILPVAEDTLEKDS